METMELLFFDRFVLLRNLFERLKTPYIIVKCTGVTDGEKLEVYTNGKMSGSHIVKDGRITIPVQKGNAYRIASPNFPYGVRFNTTDAHDNTDDILMFHTTTPDSAELKNIYRIIEHLCSTVEQQKKQITSLMGYQTE